jgi:hypothetical protein
MASSGDSTGSVRLVKGPNKISVFNRVQLTDFTFLPGYHPSQFQAGVDNISHTIDFAVISIMHKAGSILHAAMEANSETFLADYGDVRLIGVEVEWFDVGNEALPDITVGASLTLSLVDGVDDTIIEIVSEDSIITLTLDDGTDTVTEDIGV